MTGMKGFAADDQARPMSGPHICSQVGTETITIAKMALLDACARSGGTISGEEIVNLLDLIANVPEVFSVYSRNFDACSKIHKNRGFSKFTARKFARVILQSYCNDVARLVFARQIANSGIVWLGHFLTGFVIHTATITNPDFATLLFERYKAMALRDGARLGLSAFLEDENIQTLVAKLMQRLHKEAKMQIALEQTVCRHLASTLTSADPARTTLIRGSMAEFFDRLAGPAKSNRFRRMVNDRIK